jgi:hypothetical protein
MEVVTLETRNKAELACQQLLHTSGADSVALMEGHARLAYSTILDCPRDSGLVAGERRARSICSARPRGSGSLRSSTAIGGLRLLVTWSAGGSGGPGRPSTVAFESVEIFRKKPS